MTVSTIGEWMTFQIKTMFLKEVTMGFFALKLTLKEVTIWFN